MSQMVRLSNTFEDYETITPLGKKHLQVQGKFYIVLLSY